jgi:hypothetical protein
MAPSPFLPDPARLDALFARLGPATAPAAPAEARQVLRFPVAPARRADASPAPSSGLQPLAELGEEDTPSLIAATGGETLEERLDAFLLWLTSSTGAFASFIADQDGLALANRHAPDSYMVATAALGLAERSITQYVPRPADASTIFDLDGNNVLQILWVSTAAGKLAVGLVLGAPLPRALADKARRMLQISVERKGNSR